MKRGSPVNLTEKTVEAQAFQMVLDEQRPLPLDRLARRLRTRVGRVEPIVAGIERGGHLLRDDDGQITAVAGLSSVPTRHEFTVDGVIRWTWCAWDAIGLVVLLDRGGVVRSTSPETGADVVVHFEHERATAEPAGAVLLFPERTDACVTVRDWCPHVNLFEDETTAKSWMERNGVSGEIQELDTAAHAAAEVFRPLLEADRVAPWWRRLGPPIPRRTSAT